jgi:hypothetical protein
VSVGIADVRSFSLHGTEPPESLSLQNSGLGDVSEGSSLVSSKNILQPYCPSLANWFSTFRSVPDDTAHLLNGKVSTDANLLLKFVRLQMRQKPFEPLFGSATIYSIIDDEIHRISESFHFDAAGESMRRYYGTCYVDTDGQEIVSTASKIIDFGGSCINVADGSGERTHMHMCHATVPDELRYKDLFLIVQLSKFMSCDAEKATAPYYTRGQAPDPPKQKESCERLCRYRQPVGLGILRLCDENGKLSGATSQGELLIPMYCQKICLSDQQIHLVSLPFVVSLLRHRHCSGLLTCSPSQFVYVMVMLPFLTLVLYSCWHRLQAIRELYPVDGSASYMRSLDPLDMEMRVVVYDLGKEEQVCVRVWCLRDRAHLRAWVLLFCVVQLCIWRTL